MIKWYKADERAQAPYKANSKAAGFDLCTIEDTVVAGWNIGAIRTGVIFTPPVGHYMRVAPRSGLTCAGLVVISGVIDPDYIGEIKIMAFNSLASDFFVPAFTRIAQVIPEKFAADCALIEDLNPPRETERGAAGFGSTGK